MQQNEIGNRNNNNKCLWSLKGQELLFHNKGNSRRKTPMPSRLRMIRIICTHEFLEQWIGIHLPYPKEMDIAIDAVLRVC